VGDKEDIMKRVEGKVAFITGAARGQGRSHAIRLAEEGADIVALDICADIFTAHYAMATEGDLAETVGMIKELGCRAIGVQADVRDATALGRATGEAISNFGQIDILCANAGIGGVAPALDITDDEWDNVIDINLTGTWKTVRAVAPAMVEQGRGGSIILTSSIAGLVAFPNLAHYTAAKHGVTGLMRTLAVELAPQRIRVNSVHSTIVDTHMIQNAPTLSLFMGGKPGATRDEAEAALKAMHALDIAWVDPVDVSNAVLWLASEEARFVTGAAIPVDGGATAPFKLLTANPEFTPTSR
jgi:SDR family mycofactocin-dependent oxidoreductase